MFTSARDAYEQGAKTAITSRQLEAAALLKCARMLEDCRQTWNEPNHAARLEDALRHNTRLWTFFQTELARQDHEMPADLRVNLLRLSRFVDRRTLEILADPRQEKLQALIDVNRNIAAGLSVTPS